MTKTLDKEKIKDSTDDGTSNGNSSVVLHNDDYHTFEEVIIQLMKAIECSPEEGYKKAVEVNNSGRCKVFVGSMEDALYVSAILEEIDLKTTVEH